MGVSVDFFGVPKKLRAISKDPRLGAVASSEAARLMNKFVPMRTGALSESADASKPWTVTYSMPYARRIYYGDGFNFSKEMHPNARSRWDRGIDKEALAKKLTEAAKEI